MAIEGDGRVAQGDSLEGPHRVGVDALQRDLDDTGDQLAGEFGLGDVGLRPRQRDRAPLHAGGGPIGIRHGGWGLGEIKGDRLQRLDGGEQFVAVASHVQAKGGEFEGVAAVTALSVESKRQGADSGREKRFYERGEGAFELRREDDDRRGAAESDVGGEAAGDLVSVGRRDVEAFDFGDDAIGGVVDARAERDGDAVREQLVALAHRDGA